MRPRYEDVGEKARRELAQGDARAAFSTLRWVLEYPGADDLRSAWRDAFSLFGSIARASADEDFAARIEAAARGFDATVPLYDAGYHLIEQGLDGIAATVLRRAYELEPRKESVLVELVIALEGGGYNGEACALLRESAAYAEGSFWARYLLAFNAIMTTDRVTANELLPSLEQDSSSPDAPPDQAFMASTIRGMLERAAAVEHVASLGVDDLVGWHFVVTGGLLTHVSPFGFDEGMRGRYAYTQDSPGRCREGIERLRTVLSAADVAVPRVFLFSDRESHALGLASAHALGVPTERWSPSAGPGLLVAYDLAVLSSEEITSFAEHRPGQILFAHASCWTQEPAFVADVTTYVYQTNQLPWSGGVRFNPEAQKAERLPAREGTAEDLAADIVSSEAWNADPDPERFDRDALARFAIAALRDLGPSSAGALRSAGLRRKQRCDSPVKSNRFV